MAWDPDSTVSLMSDSKSSLHNMFTSSKLSIKYIYIYIAVIITMKFAVKMANIISIENGILSVNNSSKIWWLKTI